VGRSRESVVADPVLCARVWAAVEVEPQLGDLRVETLLEPLDQPAEAGLRLCDREVAVRLAGARDRVAAHRVDVERETDLLDPGDRVGDALVRAAGGDGVLLARQAGVAAEAPGEIAGGEPPGARREGGGPPD